MIAVLGAGISGLSLAYYLHKKGKEVLLIEKCHEVGGKIKSISENGFTAELGPNTVLLNNKQIIELINDVGLNEELIFADPENIQKRFILFNGKPEAIPTGLFSAIRSPLLSLSTFKKLVSAIRKKEKNYRAESIASLVRRNFGEEIYENFLVPMLTGIYAGDPEKMDADFVLPFLKRAEKEHGSIVKGLLKQKKEPDKKELPKQKIFTFRKGLQELPEAIAKKIANQLVLSAEITSIDQKKDSFYITYRKEGVSKQLKADQLISTIPSFQLSKIPSNFLTKALPALKDICYVPIAVLHLAYAKKGVGFKETAFGLLSRPPENVPFLGVLFNSRFFPHTSPKDMELITVICGGDFNKTIVNKNDNELFNEVENSLKNILQMSSPPTFRRIFRWKYAIPQYYVGHGNTLESLMEFEKQHPGFYFAGNYLNGISVSDCIRNSQLLSEKI